MRLYLAPEVENGLIDSRYYKIACSAWRQGLAFFRSILAGNYRQVRKYYQTCGNLMHKIRQSNRYEGESRYEQEIEDLRSDLVSLAEKF